MKIDLALNNLQWMICHKTKPNKTKLSMAQIELNYVFMLNWIIWNKTVWHLNCDFILNWSVLNRTVFDIYSVFLCWTDFWNRTVYMYGNRFGVNLQTMVDMPLNQTNQFNVLCIISAYIWKHSEENVGHFLH